MAAPLQLCTAAAAAAASDTRATPEAALSMWLMFCTIVSLQEQQGDVTGNRRGGIPAMH
jgi:hypothetical protein